MSECEIVPESVVRETLRQMKEDTGQDYTCVWEQGSEDGVYLQDFANRIKTSCNCARKILAPGLKERGFDIDGCDALYYTTSRLFIAVWRDEQ